MSDRVSAPRVSWKQSRYGFAVFSFLSLLGAWFLLRLVLLFAFKPAALPPVEVLLALLSGFHRDVFGALLESIPLLLWFVLARDRWFAARWHRLLFLTGAFLFWFGQIWWTKMVASTGT